MYFVKLKDMNKKILAAAIKGTGYPKNLKGNMELVWDIEKNNFRVFNWDKKIGKVKIFRIDGRRFGLKTGKISDLEKERKNLYKKYISHTPRVMKGKIIELFPIEDNDKYNRFNKKIFGKEIKILELKRMNNQAILKIIDSNPIYKKLSKNEIAEGYELVWDLDNKKFIKINWNFLEIKKYFNIRREKLKTKEKYLNETYINETFLKLLKENKVMKIKKRTIRESYFTKEYLKDLFDDYIEIYKIKSLDTIKFIREIKSLFKPEIYNELYNDEYAFCIPEDQEELFYNLLERENLYENRVSRILDGDYEPTFNIEKEIEVKKGEWSKIHKIIFGLTKGVSKVNNLGFKYKYKVDSYVNTRRGLGLIKRRKIERVKGIYVQLYYIELDKNEDKFAKWYPEEFILESINEHIF